jgi:GTPase SAR1 family protein
MFLLAPKGEKLLVVLVGLPNTGKTLIARKISRYSNSELYCTALHYTALNYAVHLFSSPYIPSLFTFSLGMATMKIFAMDIIQD